MHAGKLRFYGASVEKVWEGLEAMEFPNVQSVQIIFNIFRQRPAELFLEQAKRPRLASWRAYHWQAVGSADP